MANQRLLRASFSVVSVLWLSILVANNNVDGFVPSQNALTGHQRNPFTSLQQPLDVPVRKSNTELNMFMGSDGGILGIGTPELFTILLVGYFVLGPSDLYKLTKEIGKFVQNVRTFSAEATSTIENSMESQLQLEEIRKAQRELNDAFNFRRSINVEEDTSPFEVNAQSPRLESPTPPGAAESGVDGAPKKKTRRRRVKKKKVEENPGVEMPSMGDVNNGDVVNNIPDLALDEEMSESEKRMMESLAAAKEELGGEEEQKAASDLRAQRMERLQGSSGNDESKTAEQELAMEGYDQSLFSEDDAQNRFQAQLSGNWNEQILAKEDELSPIANIMQRLAILEEEKNAADARLQEEFKLREENEEKFYREKRKLLEEAAAKIQAEAYATTGPAADNARE